MKKFIYTWGLLLMSLMAWCRPHPLIVISLDGCRWDYPLWYDTPFLDYMGRYGVESGLIPAFPSKTFPNHYTLATGLSPDVHGIIANSFYDPLSGCTFSLGDSAQKFNPYYYGGEPIWLTAKKQGLRTAVFYWPGSDVMIGGHYPDRYYVFDDEPRLTMSQRLDAIIEEIGKVDSERPDLIMAYLEQPDASGHDFGPQSRETRQAVSNVDAMLGDFYMRLLSLPKGHQVNLIVLSDHGMTLVEPERRISLKDKLKSSWLISSSGSIPENIYVAPGCVDSVYAALKDLDHVRVWKKGDVPDYLHYGKNPRIGDIVVLPDLGYIIYDTPFTSGGGQHGYDPYLSDMHAIFRAIGPDISNVALPHFRNIHVYSLLCYLLQIQPASNESDGEATKAILKDP